MRFIVKDMDIETGGPLIAIINKKDAKFLDLHNGDRVRLNRGRRKAIAIIDIAESKRAVPSGKIGCFEELLKKLKVKGRERLSLNLVEKPKSISFIAPIPDICPLIIFCDLQNLVNVSIIGSFCST